MAGTAAAFGAPSRHAVPVGAAAAVELVLRAPPATAAGWAFAPLIGMPCGRTGSRSRSRALATDADQVVFDAADDAAGAGRHGRRGDAWIFGAEEHQLRLRGAGEDAPGETDAVGTGHGGVGEDDFGRPFSQSDHGLGLADRRPDDAGHAEPGRGGRDGLGRQRGTDAHEDGTHSDPPSLSEEITRGPQHYAL